MLRLYGRYRVGGLIGSLMKIPSDRRASEYLKFMPKSRTVIKPSSGSKKSASEKNSVLSKRQSQG